MTRPHRALGTVLVLALGLVVAACGGSKSAAPPATSTTTPAATPPATTSTSGGSTGGQSPNALQGEARSAATGDIPDTQVFVVFHDANAGYSMKYPEGWAQNGAGGNVSFRDKNNVVRIVVQTGKTPTIASVRADLNALKHSTPSLTFRSPTVMTINATRAIKVVYSTQSAPNPVTNKRVNLTVDRYYLPHGGKVAIVDLGTPVGVDNVDAYRMMIQSLRWR
jgi:hypothetical protein